MAVLSNIVPVSTTPALLSDGSGSAGSSIIVQAPAAATLYLGGPAVTPATGYPLVAGASLQRLQLEGASDQLYGVLAAGTDSVPVLMIGV